MALIYILFYDYQERFHNAHTYILGPNAYAFFHVWNSALFST